ncbi:hypothetical protein EGM88_07240 [Aureibaculum marinum]|uniref:Dihydroorotase n=1 Tax=Aureibaculum marinum TaxID=2487930 RepID=A0A3N4PEJ4_9FLAO|nr:hypothetical protein [Aureibaculum marinum]RPD97953.1 hypothetical protein EGM88_07240 [Aureibaculum marinum]
MKKYVVAFLLTICSFSLFSQNISPDDIKEGSEFKIGKPLVESYKHINFPKPNFIIKRGGIVNYKNIEGSSVLVTDIKEKKNGTTIAKIKRKDGKRFFGSYKVVTVDIDNALTSGELIAD